MRIEVPNWTELQHYKGRDPLFIKLYRRLRQKRAWRTLPGDEAKCLIDVWLLSSEQPTAGVIDLSLEDLAWELRADAHSVQVWVARLAGAGFLVVLDDASEPLAERVQPAIPHALAREETETEREKETTAPASPAADVEKSGRVDGRPVYTRGELWDAADRILGLGKLPSQDHATNGRLLNEWLYGRPPRDPFEIMLAIEGAADMRDRDLIGWESAKPGTPMTLKALNGAATLADQGDGRAVRTLYHVAIEHQRKREEAGTTRPPTRPKAGALKRVASLVPHAV